MSELHELKTLTLAGEAFNTFPDQTAREGLEKKIPKPAGTAAVGQYLRVLSVDENGKITAVEAVEAPTGTEIDVTGAVVGQTVKVSAVDDNGVPTAWEPVDFPDSGGNADYELPVATAETLGGVMPVAKTEAMTQPVGVDENGALYTEPSESSGSDYVLPVGGDVLGGVKNGGNVTINEDGTMTAPETEITDEQVSTAVDAWLDEHPEATTTIADGAVTPVKTSFMPENQDIIATLDDVTVIKAGIRSAGSYYYHAYMKNNGLSLSVEGLSKIVVKAFVSYINWIQTATEVTASSVSVISNGYTTENPSMYGATADTDAAEMREVEIDIAEGASYILIDFGLTAPTYVSVGVPNGTYRFEETVQIADKLSRPKNEDGDYADGEAGQVLYANGETPYWGNKINPGDVNAEATTFWGSDNLSIRVKAQPLPKIETAWRYQYIQAVGSDGSTTFHYSVADTTQNGYLVKLNAGETYMVMTTNRQLRYFTAIPSLVDLTEAQAANLDYAGYDSSTYKMLSCNPSSYGLYQTYGGKITPENDVWMVCNEVNYPVSSDPYVYEVYKWDDVEYLSTLTGSEIYIKSAGDNKKGIYSEPFTYIQTSYYGDMPAYYEQYETNEQMRRLIRQTDRLDSLALSNFRLGFIGDSITLASSNAGLQRAFRKMLPYKLQTVQTTTAVAGTCMTNGYGTAWSCAVQGVDGLLTDADYIETLPDNPHDRPHIFMIALGTNDFGNNAPLGDVESEDRDTTFAGCYLKLIEAIRANYPKAGIILMCPFNRNNGNTANENGNILLDYCRVIHEIASFTPHTWVLDLSNHPIINYAGYPSAYVDGVHIGKYAHAVVSNELYRLIMEIVAVSGFDYLPCLDRLNV